LLAQVEVVVAHAPAHKILDGGFRVASTRLGGTENLAHRRRRIAAQKQTGAVRALVGAHRPAREVDPTGLGNDLLDGSAGRRQDRRLHRSLQKCDVPLDRCGSVSGSWNWG
jgi:hypothetical protein